MSHHPLTVTDDGLFLNLSWTLTDYTLYHQLGVPGTYRTSSITFKLYRSTMEIGELYIDQLNLSSDSSLQTLTGNPIIRSTFSESAVVGPINNPDTTSVFTARIPKPAPVTGSLAGYFPDEGNYYFVLQAYYTTNTSTAPHGASPSSVSVGPVYITKPSFNVTYDANAGNNLVQSMPESGVVSGTFFTVSSAIPSRPGYSFGGWNSQADGLGNFYTANYQVYPSGDVVLYAIWADPTAPSPPTGVTVTPGSRKVTVSFEAPASDGGSPIIGYIIWAISSIDVIQAYPAPNETTNFEVSGLTNDRTYEIRILAFNSIGNSAVVSIPNVTPVSPVSSVIQPGVVASYIAAQPNLASAPEPQKAEVAINAREAIKQVFDDVTKTPEEKASAKLEYVNSMRSAGITELTVPSSKFADIVGTAAKYSGIMAPKPVTILFPAFTTPEGGASYASVTLPSQSTSEYMGIEAPLGAQITLTDGLGGSLSLVYEGTTNAEYKNLETNVTYTTGDNLQIGTKTIKIIAIGSLFYLDLPQLATPTGLTAVAGNGQVTLSWNDVDENTSNIHILNGESLVANIPDITQTSYTVTGLTNGDSYTFSIVALGDGEQNVDSNVASFASVTPIANNGGDGGSGGVVCFLGNAPVLTPSGYRRIDSLAVGDMVRTADGRDVAIQRVKHQRVVAPSAAVNPYVIPKGTLGATENLAISPRHAVAVPGRGMVEARELGLRQLSMKAAFDYYNLELPEWDNMVVAGVEVESLAPKKRVVMTAAQFRELVGGRSIDLARLARMATVRADGSVDVTLTRKARRM